MEEIYDRGMNAWNGMDTFRRRRRRSKRYVFGDQWDDIVTVDGVKMSERQYILEQGQNPLKNNILRRILRNVVGVYRANYNTPAEAVREIFQRNKMEQLMPRMLEEFLISGLSVVKVVGRNKKGKGGELYRDTLIFPVTPDNFFFHSDGYDPRGWDTDLIGEIHNVSYVNLMARFCKDEEELARLEAIYSECKEGNQKCRVTEVWYKTMEIMALVHDKERSCLERVPMNEVREKYRDRRDKIELRSEIRDGWKCVWFAHDGTVLSESEVMRSHPYVWKVYPFIDGEVHSYMGDLIDQQRYVNHLITLYDFIMKSSAKGVLLFPDESLPRGMSLQDVADEWSRFNGVIPYRSIPGTPLPTQVSGNAANIGITELLNIEMQMIEDISGVSPTLQGKLENTAASGTLFAQQNQAAMTSLLDVVKSFDEFVDDIVRKVSNRE